MGLFSLYGVGTGHARLGRLEDFTFLAPSELLAATRTGGSQATLASRRPCAVLTSLSVLQLLTRRTCAARCSQRGPEGSSRKLRSRGRRLGVAEYSGRSASKLARCAAFHRCLSAAFHAMLRGCGACCACSASGVWPVPLPQARSRVPVRCICCAGMPGFCMMPG